MSTRGEPAQPRDLPLRRLRTRFPSGIVVVACRTPLGLRGVTVSSFAVVSLAPPLVLFCLDRELESEALLRAAGGIGISILSDRQEILAQRFAAAAPLMDDAFAGAPYFERQTGAPLLEGAVAWLDCRPEALHDGGDHTIFVARVVWSAEHPRQPLPLVTFSRQYADLCNLRQP
jgi:flavin reductase (DIM6/NTAB) family NADH-FMN oxidoreductase RutF